MYVKMTLERALAVRICGTFLSLDEQLNDLVRQAQPQLSEEDLDHLRKAVGDILGIMYIEIMKNVFDSNPDLKPPGLP